LFKILFEKKPVQHGREAVQMMCVEIRNPP